MFRVSILTILFFVVSCSQFSSDQPRFTGGSDKQQKEQPANSKDVEKKSSDQNYADSEQDQADKQVSAEDRVVADRDSDSDLGESPCRYFNKENRGKKEAVDFEGKSIPFDSYAAAIRGIPEGEDLKLSNVAVFDQIGQGQAHTDWNGARGAMYKSYDKARIADYKSANCKLLTGVGNNQPTPNGGCFDENAKIQLANDQVKLIKDIELEDMVYNPILKKSFKINRRIGGPETGFMYEIGINNKIVIVTDKHPMPTANGIKQAKAVTKVDKLLGEDGKYHKISMLKKVAAKPSQRVINLVINENNPDPMAHMVLVDGMVTGDLWLQEQLDKKNQSLAKAKKQKNSIAKK